MVQFKRPSVEQQVLAKRRQECRKAVLTSSPAHIVEVSIALQGGGSAPPHPESLPISLHWNFSSQAHQCLWLHLTQLVTPSFLECFFTCLPKP